MGTNNELSPDKLIRELPEYAKYLSTLSREELIAEAEGRLKENVEILQLAKQLPDDRAGDQPTLDETETVEDFKTELTAWLKTWRDKPLPLTYLVKLKEDGIHVESYFESPDVEGLKRVEGTFGLYHAKPIS